MKKEKQNRIEAIQNLIASIAVMTLNLDLEMSAAIMATTSEKFGEEYTARIMEEILQVLNEGTAPEKDILNHAAALAFIRPQPINWKPTIH